METIFNHSITDIEFTSLFGRANRASFEQRYTEYRNADCINFDLHRLYGIRGDEEKTQTYLEKIEDANIRRTAVQLHDYVP